MTPSELSISIDDGRATVVLTGEHEAYSADRLARALDGLLAEGVPVDVDLTRTEFIDSTVIGTLLAARRRAQAQGLDFVLVLGEHTGWPVRRILEVTGLYRHFDVVG